MIRFRNNGELVGTAYAHTLTPGPGGDDLRIQEAWTRTLARTATGRERLQSGADLVERVEGLTVWPGQLSGRIPNPGSPFARVEAWLPQLDDDSWRFLAEAARPKAAHLVGGTAHDAAVELLALADRAGIDLLYRLEDVERGHCACPSRRIICPHIAALLTAFAQCLAREPLTLLLLNGRTAIDFFATVDNLDHPSGQPDYRPPSLKTPTVDAPTAYARWNAQSAHRPLPPIPAAPAEDPDMDHLPKTGNPQMRLLGAFAVHAAASALRDSTEQCPQQ